MDTSTAPHISPVLEAETKAALMLRYVEDHQEVAFVPVDDKKAGADVDSRALPHRFTWPY